MNDGFLSMKKMRIDDFLDMLVVNDLNYLVFMRGVCGIGFI